MFQAIRDASQSLEDAIVRKLDEVSDYLAGKPLIKRHNRWPFIRKHHLLDFPCCEVCGKNTDIEVHHIIPVHIDPTKELTLSNLITLCRRNGCHFLIGHGRDWHAFNPQVIEDAAGLRNMIENRRYSLVQTFYEESHMAKKGLKVVDNSVDDPTPYTVDWVELTKVIFQGLKDIVVVMASVATIYFQTLMSVKQDVVLAKQDQAAQTATEVKKALDKNMSDSENLQ